MKRLLRDSLPQIVGTLAATAILTLIGLLYTQLGLWVATLALLVVLTIAVAAWLVASRRKKPKPLLQETESQLTGRMVQQPQQGNSARKQTVLFVDDDIEIIELWCNYANRCTSPFNPRLIILQAAT
jgi:membrane protein implicated in regulation of membrane protease activity